MIVRCDRGGNYASGVGPHVERANLIELICSDSDDSLRPRYEHLACEIGRRLGWEVTDGDDGPVLLPGRAKTFA